GSALASTCDRRQVHDGTAAAGDHLPRDALQAKEHTLAVHAHDAVPVLLGEVHHVGAPGHPGVVHEHVDPPEAVDDPADHAVDALEVPDVGAEGQPFAPERADGVGGRL